MENDFKQLRPINFEELSNGAKVCDSRGRPLELLSVPAMIATNGIDSIYMLPLAWSEGRPIYPDDMLQGANGVMVGAGIFKPSDLILALSIGEVTWPKKVMQSVKLYINDELVEHKECGSDWKPTIFLMHRAFEEED